MKVKINEFKRRLGNGVNGLVDTYFSGQSVSDRLMNATVKIVIKQNMDKLDNVFELFSDKDGYIDTDMMMVEYTKAFGGDKFILDIRDFVSNDMVRGVLPNKALAIKIEDIAEMFEDS